MPMPNGSCDRSKKSACDRVIPLGERHLRRTIAEYVEHYLRERNHQGIENALIAGAPATSGLVGSVGIRGWAVSSTITIARRDRRLDRAMGQYAVRRCRQQRAPFAAASESAGFSAITTAQQRRRIASFPVWDTTRSAARRHAAALRLVHTHPHVGQRAERQFERVPRAPFDLRRLATPPSRESEQTGTEKKKRRGFGHRIRSDRFAVNEIVHRDDIRSLDVSFGPKAPLPLVIRTRPTRSPALKSDA